MLKRRRIKLAFPLIIFAVLLASTIFACFGFVKVNKYENRTAEKVPFPTIRSYADGSFQEKCESGLGDQLPLAIAVKDSFNTCKSFVLDKLIKKSFDIFADNTSIRAISENTSKLIDVVFDREIEKTGTADTSDVLEVPNFRDDRYYMITNSVYNFNGQLVGMTEKVSEDTPAGGLIPEINSVIEEGLADNVYVAYVEREFDIDFSTGEKSGLYKYIRNGINLDDDHICSFSVDSFDSYDQLFYKTDHHWNHKGSYIGYRIIMDMLKPEDQCLYPENEQYIGIGSGSRARGSAQNYNEAISVFNYDFPEYFIVANGEVKNDFSDFTLISKAAEKGVYRRDLGYNDIYGDDEGEIIIRNQDQNSRGNYEKILILGDSFDNALLKLIASHYGTVYSVDTRYYENDQRKFVLKDYLKENSIDTILFVGRNEFFLNDDFLFE